MQNDIINGEDISADAITNCMKTTRNTLSTWKISNESEIEDAVLAIVSGHHHLDSIDVICLNSKALKMHGLTLEDTPGATPLESFSERHVDIINLSYTSLGAVANQIVENIKDGKVKRYTKGMQKKILKIAIESGRLKRDKLHPSLSMKLQ